jgi:hypothetical protein
MRHQRTIRLMVCAALAGSASLAAVAIPGGIATASPLTVSCTNLSGSATSQTISGCTGTGAVAADAGVPPAHGTSVVSTKTVTWSNHKTSKETYTYKSSSTANCPAVPKYTKDLRETASGKVTGGSATGMVGGAVSGTVCIYKLTAAPHTLIVKNVGPFKL